MSKACTTFLDVHLFNFNFVERGFPQHPQPRTRTSLTVAYALGTPLVGRIPHTITHFPPCLESSALRSRTKQNLRHRTLHAGFPSRIPSARCACIMQQEADPALYAVHTPGSRSVAAALHAPTVRYISRRTNRRPRIPYRTDQSPARRQSAQASATGTPPHHPPSPAACVSHQPVACRISLSRIRRLQPRRLQSPCRPHIRTAPRRCLRPPNPWQPGGWGRARPLPRQW